MNMPPTDKVAHAGVGIAIALLLAPLGLLPSLIAPYLAGLAKEQADQRANDRAVQAGLLPTHGVEAADANSTGIAGALAALWIWWLAATPLLIGVWP